MITLQIQYPASVRRILMDGLKPIAMRQGFERFVGVIDNWQPVVEQARAEAAKSGWTVEVQELITKSDNSTALVPR